MNGQERDSRTPALPAWVRRRAGEFVLALHVQPGARRSAIVGPHGGRLKIALQAPPVDGKANAELLRFLALALMLQRSDLRLLAGSTRREKALAVAADPAGLVLSRLLTLAPPLP